jgi:hypothetical protein
MNLSILIHVSVSAVSVWSPELLGLDLPLTARPLLLLKVNDFDEILTLDRELLDTPAFRRCGLLFQRLRNMTNKRGTFSADGYVVSVQAQDPDFNGLLVRAWFLSKREVLFKCPIAPCNLTRGEYGGLYEQANSQFAAYVNDPAFPRRLFHLVLVKFPPSDLVENLFSTSPGLAEIDPDFIWVWYSADSEVPTTNFVQFPIALSASKSCIGLAPDIPEETPQRRAIRESRERAEVALAAGRGGGGGGRGGGGGHGTTL